MSRHVIPHPDGLEVVVGWDPPLNTFFAQVFAGGSDVDDPTELLWVGCSPREIHNVEQVRSAVAPWVPLPEGVARALYADAHGGSA